MRVHGYPSVDVRACTGSAGIKHTTTKRQSAGQENTDQKSKRHGH